jgi:predicted permease
MEKHIPLVGILNIVYRSLMLIGSFVLFAIAIGFRYFFELISRYDHHGMDEIPPFVMDIVPFILTAVGILLMVFSIMGIIGAVGVLKRKEWGRIITLVISFFNLLHIPLGTILGVYSIWVLLNDETVRLFNPVVNASAEKPTIQS